MDEPQRQELLAVEAANRTTGPPQPKNRISCPMAEWRVFSPQTINYEQIQLDSGNKAHQTPVSFGATNGEARSPCNLEN